MYFFEDLYPGPSQGLKFRGGGLVVLGGDNVSPQPPPCNGPDLYQSVEGLVNPKNEMYDDLIISWYLPNKN